MVENFFSRVVGAEARLTWTRLEHSAFDGLARTLLRKPRRSLWKNPNRRSVTGAMFLVVGW